MHLNDLYGDDDDNADNWLLMQGAEKGQRRICLLIQNAFGKVWRAFQIHQLLFK